MQYHSAKKVGGIFWGNHENVAALVVRPKAIFRWMLWREAITTIAIVKLWALLLGQRWFQSVESFSVWMIWMWVKKLRRLTQSRNLETKFSRLKNSFIYVTIVTLILANDHLLIFKVSWSDQFWKWKCQINVACFM